MTLKIKSVGTVRFQYNMPPAAHSALLITNSVVQHSRLVLLFFALKSVASLPADLALLKYSVVHVGPKICSTEKQCTLAPLKEMWHSPIYSISQPKIKFELKRDTFWSVTWP
jgi:hypothetical protein